jgi:hypothetical protein
MEPFLTTWRPFMTHENVDEGALARGQRLRARQRRSCAHQSTSLTINVTGAEVLVA